mmetsp:Transcript_19301/g.22987  ORF Transcript_19301/g.22987 Transcript_19301/m.22987 type:complete len:88 (+) Transcript_19301:585-848(+)
MYCVCAWYHNWNIAIHSLFSCNGWDITASSTNQFVQDYENFPGNESSKVGHENHCADHSSFCPCYIPFSCIFHSDMPEPFLLYVSNV